MKNLFREAINYYTTALAREAAEAAADITRIEAAYHDTWARDLEAITSDPDKRQKIRDSAILIAQLGVREDEIEEMVRLFLLMKGYGVSVEDARHLSAIIHRPRR